MARSEEAPLLRGRAQEGNRSGHGATDTPSDVEQHSNSSSSSSPTAVRVAAPRTSSKRRLIPLALVSFAAALALGYLSTSRNAEAPARQQQKQQQLGETSGESSSLATTVSGGKPVTAATTTTTAVGSGAKGVEAAGGRHSSSSGGSPAAAGGAAAATSVGNQLHGLPKAGEASGRASGGGSGSERASKGQAGGWRSGRKQGPGFATNLDGGSKEAGASRDGSGDGSSGSSSSSGKPNVFFFMIDDMGYGDIGYQSTDLSKLTPNLDALMEGGIKLSNYYSLSLCTPARASLMTGRYPVRYGMQYSVIVPGAAYGLPLDEKVLPEYMNEAGYESHMVGKWHIGSFNDASLPNRRGFKTYMGYLNGVETYYEHFNSEAYLDGHAFYDFGFGNETDYYDVTHTNKEGGDCAGPVIMSGQDWDAIAGGDPADVCYTGTYSEDAFFGRARQVVSEKTPWDKEPLFLYVAHQSVHSPIGPAPEGFFTPEEEALLEEVKNGTNSAHRAQFGAVLLYLDKKIGEFLDELDEEGWLDNSIVVVASDNGGCPSNGGCNYPLRGAKQALFEGGTKVPAMMWSRSHIPEDLWGTEYDKMMHVTDWLPTLTTAVGGELSGGAGPLDGIDHWDSMVASGVNGEGDGVEGPRTNMLYNWDPYLLSSGVDLTYNRDLTQGAYREGEWKLIVNGFCSGYFSHDLAVVASDPLINPEVTCPGTAECEDCSDQCEEHSMYGFRNELFNLDADPREKNNVLEEYPEIADRLMKRANELVYSEWMDSNYMKANTEAYLVWKDKDWWMSPWADHLPAGSSRS